MSTSSNTSRHGVDVSSNFEFHRQRALQARGAYLRELVAEGMPTLPAISPGAKRIGAAFAAAFAVATVAFWAIMLVSPPQTAASMVDSGRLQAREGAASTGAVFDRCSVGTEVSNFVCRNTWMDHHAYSYR